MKLHISDATVSGQGFEAVDGFKIEMNPKAFKVLSDTLYKNKIGSIVRELSCNAFDAHIMAGNADRPFEIHLPDAFEPYFSIRDFGTGISHEDIKRVYTSYFTSTKDQENESVGAFGLGSKTPFAYTDAFTVISIHNGIKTMYNAHMNGGLPAIVAYGKPEPTDEPDGLEVNVSVESVDYKAFADAVQKQLKFFSVKPTILNGSVEWTSITEILNVPGFVYYSIDGASSYSYYNRERNHMAVLFLKQGPVAYPVDFDILNQYLNSNGMKKTEFYSYLESSANAYNKGVIIDMPIGTVEVTASREGISYSDVTIRNILSKFDSIARQIFKDVERLLDTSYKEGNVSFIKALNGLDQYFKSTINPDDMKKRYPRFTFSARNAFPMLKLGAEFSGMEVRKYDMLSWSKPRATQNFTISELGEDANGNKLNYRLFNLEDIANLGVVYIKDINTNFVARMKEDTSERHAVMVELPTGVTVKQFKKALGTGIDYRLISELDEVKVVRTGQSSGHSITGGKNRLWFDVSPSLFNGYSFRYDLTLYRLGCNQVFGESFETYVDENPDDKFVYLNTHLNKVDSAATKSPFDNYGELALFMEWLNGQDYRVVAIANAAVPAAEKTGAFTSLADAWKQHRTAFINAQWDMLRKVVLTDYYSRFNQIYEPRYGNRTAIRGSLDFFDALNIKTDLRSRCEVLAKSAGEHGFSLNRAMRTFIENHMTANQLKQYDNFVDSYVQRRSKNAATETFLAMEADMLAAGWKPPVLVSKVIDDYCKVVKDNIVNLLAYATTKNASTNWISAFTVAVPFEYSQQGFYLSQNGLIAAIKQKLA